MSWRTGIADRARRDAAPPKLSGKRLGIAARRASSDCKPGDGVLFVNDRACVSHAATRRTGHEAAQSHHHARRCRPNDPAAPATARATAATSAASSVSTLLQAHPPMDSHVIGICSAGTMRAQGPDGCPSQTISCDWRAQQARPAQVPETMSASKPPAHIRTLTLRCRRNARRAAPSPWPRE